MDNYNIIAELELYTTNNSILIIDVYGKLSRINAPAIAKCILCIEGYLVGDNVEITAFKISMDLRLVYVIEGKAYYHCYFEILF